MVNSFRANNILLLAQWYSGIVSAFSSDTETEEEITGSETRETSTNCVGIYIYGLLKEQ